jgi:1-acyl-sn-glycerol-3-phosphate acyltransferase
MSFFKVIKAIFKYPLMLIFGVRITGKENVPRDGGFLVCVNHTSMADVILVALAMRAQPRFMAKKEALYVPVIGAFLRALGAFSVDRGGADVGAVKKAISIIKDGGVVSIFPQGHRYPKVAARTTPVRHGAGLIAYRAGCGVLPAYIKTKSGKVKAFHRNEIVIGEMIPNEDLCFEKGGSDEYRRASEFIFDRICDIGVSAGAPLEVAAAESVGNDAVLSAGDAADELAGIETDADPSSVGAEDGE